MPLSGRITPIYLDTSCAIRLFVSETQEAGSERLSQELGRLKDFAFLSSDLLRIEMESAIRAKIRSGVLSDKDHYVLRRSWDELLEKVVLRPVTPELIQSAVLVMRTSKIAGRVRSLDSIHFATFMEMAAQFPDCVLFTADASMAELAHEQQARVFNPLRA